MTTTWTDDELARIGDAEELHLASARADGELRDPVTIWVVRDGDDLYVRSMNGRDGAWFHGTEDRHEGEIHAGGVDKHVTFEESGSDQSLNTRLDTAYHTKYDHYGPRIVGTVVNPEAAAATLRLVPHP
ncbi:DUF2255 family protein [Actinomadura flavalba]|uniref:DUF2255 family protein n=1 Tax=Actinomadura flavalba TaxID=1120938 RepID=UPI0003625FE6|nr:DUF2255 family protein [Actinomadura flavalba]